MELTLTFASGRLTGEGLDGIGPFAVKGGYDAVARECYWTKTYLGAHSVYYRGYREGKGIWGSWEINVRCHGGFHIWPRAEGLGETEAEENAEPVADAIAPPVHSGAPTPVALPMNRCPVAQVGNLPCRRLVVGRVFGRSGACGLPIRDTAD